MNILHIGDHSGVAAVTSNMCTRLGHPSVVVVGKADRWNHGDYYKNTLHVKHLLKVLEATIEDYDHVVYHDSYNMAAELDHFHIPSSFMFHGNELRDNPDIGMDVDNLESIDNLFVTTEDLMKYAPTAELFRRPIDLDLFVSDHTSKRLDMGVCLTDKCYMIPASNMTDISDRVVLVADRGENIRSYDKMPDFLNSLKYYYDIKFKPTSPPMVIPDLSMTGLQALACGVAVWSNGIWFTKFPEVHSDEWVCKEFISVLEDY